VVELGSQKEDVIPSNLFARQREERLSRDLGVCPRNAASVMPPKTQIPPLILTAQARLGTALGMAEFFGDSAKRYGRNSPSTRSHKPTTKD